MFRLLTQPHVPDLTLLASTLGLLMAGCSAEDVTSGTAEDQAVPIVAASPSAVADETQPEVDLSDYPLATCVVSGAELGTMGRPFPVTVEKTRVALCCSGCEGELRSDPATYLTKLQEQENVGEADDAPAG